MELVELEVRELLTANEFPGDEVLIVRGSALAALESASTDIGAAEYAPILELMRAVDEYIPTPERAVEQPYLMPVEDVFGIKGRGTVVTGRIERGQVKVGQEIEIVGMAEGAPRRVVVTGRGDVPEDAGLGAGGGQRRLPLARGGAGRDRARAGAGAAGVSIKPHKPSSRRRSTCCRRRRGGGTRRSSPATGRSSTCGPPT